MTELAKVPPESDDLEMIEYVTTALTFSIEEVADWHYTDVVLDKDWERPLLKLLRFFVEDSLPGELDPEPEPELCLLDATDPLIDLTGDSAPTPGSGEPIPA